MNKRGGRGRGGTSERKVQIDFEIGEHFLMNPFPRIIGRLCQECTRG